MGNTPWSSTRGRPHPRGGHAGLPEPESGLSPAGQLEHAIRLVSAAALAPATDAELRGEQEALAGFREAFPESSTCSRLKRRRPVSPSTLGARLGIAAAAATLSLGGLSAAAMTGTLPDSAQHVAHQVVGAPPVSDEGDETEDSTEATEPAERRTDDSAETDADATKTEDSESSSSAPTDAVGPDATGPAAFGLCTAYSHAGDKGQAAERSVAFRNLAEAAGGEDEVEAYCAEVEHPSSDAKATDEDADSGATQPSGRPTDKPKHEKPSASSHTQHQSGTSGATAKSHGKSGSHRR